MAGKTQLDEHRYTNIKTKTMKILIQLFIILSIPTAFVGYLVYQFIKERNTDYD